MAGPLLTVDANRGGGDAIQTSSDTGCSCHSSSPSSGIVYSVEGLPSNYELDHEYELVILVAMAETGRGEASGFALAASGGTLEATSEDVQVASSGEVTHTSDSVSKGNWTVKWTSPEKDEGNIIFDLSVMIVNGNGINDEGDMWQSVKLTSKGEATEGGGGGHEGETEYGVPLPAYWLGVTGLLLTLAVAGFGAIAIKVTHGK